MEHISISSERPRLFLLGALISALLYSALFFFNDWITEMLKYDLGVSWIYLPAGLRLFLILIFGLAGAIGIAAASFAISYFGVFPPDLFTCIGIGLISGFAPLFAKWVVVSNTYISNDLSNLSMQKILLCIVVYALMSSAFHQYWFVLRDLESGSLNHFLVMFAGDVAGSILLTALIKYGIDLMRRGVPRRS
ncbi:hypothetical protein [Polynucleobacter difficilis]|uniref:hypothetical protein n=1 Tax=Polynucleobacter difficilis TaxID=556054 RepID=UPI000D3C661B|nr:hypothetical protein [Polynucleobacter difficilis]